MSIPGDYPTFILSTNAEAELAIATERVRAALERDAERPRARAGSTLRRLLAKRRRASGPRPA